MVELGLRHYSDWLGTIASYCLIVLATLFLTSPLSLHPSLQAKPSPISPRGLPSTNCTLIPTHFQPRDRIISFSSLHRLEPNDANARGSVVLTKCALDVVGCWLFETLLSSALSSEIDERVAPLRARASSLRGPSASAVLRSLAHLVLQSWTPHIGRKQKRDYLLLQSTLIWLDISDCW